MKLLPGSSFLPAFVLATLLLAVRSPALGNVDPVGMRDETDAAVANDEKMAWWREAKFGLFIHWGVYAVPARKSEWVMAMDKIPVAEYRAFAKNFNPVHYDPVSWAKMAKNAGMRYMVITSKHHEGFALWPSDASDWDIGDATPYKKDLLGPLAEAARAEGLKFGLYYSQGQDWVNKGGGRYGPTWDPAQDGDFDEYLHNVALPQVKEILTRYKPDILWWDTPAYMNPERAQYFIDLLADQPHILMNNRLGGRIPGDFKTPEQYVPAGGYSGDWETCMTIGNSWGYVETEKPAKTAPELIRKLAEIVSKGGNFLLNISPKPDGSLPEDQVSALEGVGQWMAGNSASIYGTTRSPFDRLSWGYATQKGKMVYLHVTKWPADGRLLVPLLNKRARATLLASPDTELPVSYEDNRLVIDVPPEAPDPANTVIALQLTEDPKAIPSPLAGAAVSVSSEDPDRPASNLMDGGRDSAWAAQKGETMATLDFVLKEPVVLNGFAFDEPETGERPKQKFLVETEVNGAWTKLAEGTTNDARGAQGNFKPQALQSFRITLETEKVSPTLAEFRLYRPE